MTQTVPIKTGETFSYGGTLKLPAGTWSVAAKLKDQAGTVIQSLAISLGSRTGPDDDGLYSYPILIVASAAQTANWPLNQLRGDVKATDSSTPPIAVPSETFLVDVEEGIT